MTGLRHSLRRTACGSVAAVLVLATSMGDVLADPSADALAKLKELSEQAVQTRQAVTAAQRDVDAKQAAQASAEERHNADLAALDVANAALQPHQAAANRVAAMTYMSGGTGQMAAVLTATSPQHLIGHLALQKVVAAEAAEQIRAFRSGRERAAAAANASEESAAEARIAAERAAALRAELQDKWRELQRQISAAEAQYSGLTPQQRAVVDVSSAVPADIPEGLPAGVASEAGLQPNSILAARAVSARFPQISEIGGVRPDSKPWHPSGLAIDVMIPNPSSPEGIALGDEILAFVLSNAARFGLQDAIWRGTYYTPSGPQSSGYGHFDHVHVTTTPSH